jgi:hypothetical protein
MIYETEEEYILRKNCDNVRNMSKLIREIRNLVKLMTEVIEKERKGSDGNE